MTAEKADFTLAFRRLADLACPKNVGAVESLFEFSDAFSKWLEHWREVIERDPRNAADRQADMYQANPVFIPRNHLVAEAIDSAVDKENFEPFHALVDLLQEPRPYEPGLARYATPPRPEQVVSQTFCGT